MKAQNIFFDLDRTLWDFEENSKNALYDIYQNENLNDYFEHFLEFLNIYKKINKSLWQDYSKRRINKNELRDGRFIKCFEYKNCKNDKLALKISKLYVEISPYKTKLFPNTIETLNYLYDKNYKLHIITNGFEEVQYIKLKNCKLDYFFENVICSENIGYNKPDKRIFEYALKIAKSRAEEAYMIGDDLKVDILGANQIGINTILFDPNNEYNTNRLITKIKCLNELTNHFF